jgi:hypothetical protein
MYGLSVTVERCRDGVEMVEMPLPVPAGPTIAQGAGLDQGGAPIIFRHRTTGLETTKLEFTTLENLVVLEFINATDDERRRRFFERFGFPVPGSSVLRDEVLTNQERLLRLLACTGADDAAPAMETANAVIADYKGSDLLPVWHLAGSRGRPHVSLECRSLLSFMLMEVSNAIAYEARLASCQHCGTMFLTGKLTFHRSSAKFCSDRCRVGAARARQVAEIAALEEEERKRSRKKPNPLARKTSAPSKSPKRRHAGG